ncbi:hypothetical protein B0J17DRAFT_655404 [Rhizoctonia solani]|nr:hypothetical protein B0J17DRAFT_655404 [Rhizoctonia solani]
MELRNCPLAIIFMSPLHTQHTPWLLISRAVLSYKSATSKFEVWRLDLPGSRLRCNFPYLVKTCHPSLVCGVTNITKPRPGWRLRSSCIRSFVFFLFAPSIVLQLPRGFLVTDSRIVLASRPKSHSTSST